MVEFCYCLVGVKSLDKNGYVVGEVFDDVVYYLIDFFVKFILRGFCVFILIDGGCCYFVY